MVPLDVNHAHEENERKTFFFFAFATFFFYFFFHTQIYNCSRHGRAYNLGRVINDSYFFISILKEKLKFSSCFLSFLVVECKFEDVSSGSGSFLSFSSVKSRREGKIFLAYLFFLAHLVTLFKFSPFSRCRLKPIVAFIEFNLQDPKKSCVNKGVEIFQ